MILKAILCVQPGVQHLDSFGAMQNIVNLPIKVDSTVICIPCMLDRACLL